MHAHINVINNDNTIPCCQNAAFLNRSPRYMTRICAALRVMHGVYPFCAIVKPYSCQTIVLIIARLSSKLCMYTTTRMNRFLHILVYVYL